MDDTVKNKKDEAIGRIMGGGYRMVYEYEDPADKVVPDDNRTGDRLVIVLRGSIEVDMEGKKQVLKEGGEIFIPVQMPYSTKMGPEGCTYLVGEKAPAV